MTIDVIARASRRDDRSNPPAPKEIASACGLAMTVVLTALLIAGCAAPQKQVPIFATVPSGELRWMGEMPALHLRGTPYEMGYQHGTLMPNEVRSSVKRLLAFADRQLSVRGIGRWVARRKLDRAWKRMKPRVPDRYLEEMQGLADGAGIPLRVLAQVHALPEAAPSAGAVLSVPEALILYEPKGRRSFLSIGRLGFIGVFSGVNRARIQVTELRVETAAGPEGLEGIPGPFLARKVLEESDDLEQAAKIGGSFTLSRADQKMLEVKRRGQSVQIDLESLFSP